MKTFLILDGSIGNPVEKDERSARNWVARIRWNPAKSNFDREWFEKTGGSTGAYALPDLTPGDLVEFGGDTGQKPRIVRNRLYFKVVTYAGDRLEVEELTPAQAIAAGKAALEPDKPREPTVVTAEAIIGAGLKREAETISTASISARSESEVKTCAVSAGTWVLSYLAGHVNTEVGRSNMAGALRKLANEIDPPKVNPEAAKAHAALQAANMETMKEIVRAGMPPQSATEKLQALIASKVEKAPDPKPRGESQDEHEARVAKETKERLERIRSAQAKTNASAARTEEVKAMDPAKARGMMLEMED